MYTVCCTLFFNILHYVLFLNVTFSKLISTNYATSGTKDDPLFMIRYRLS
jgi:hypothetical protein